jgi:hypothetical protein
MSLEQELRDLGATLFPPEPDLRAAVAANLEPRPRRPRALVLALAVLAVLAVAALATLAVPQARSALERWLGIGAARIVQVEKLPPLRPSGTALTGDPITERDAASTGTLVVPGVLGTPNTILRTDQGDVVLGWGRPARIRLLEIQQGGQIVEKFVTTAPKRVRVGDHPALWIAGPHAAALSFGQPELAGPVLVWEQDGITLRLDGRVDEALALRIARSSSVRTP